MAKGQKGPPRVGSLDHTMDNGHLSVRRIENGHLISHSHQDSNGEYVNREFFSKNPPKVRIPKAPEAEPPNHMTHAKRELER